MSLLESLNCFLKIFYIFGLSPKFNKISKDVAKNPLTIISFLISILVSVAGVFLINMSILKEDLPVETIMANFFLTCEIIKFSCIFVQSFFFCHIMAEIFYNFDNIYELFNSFLCWRIDYAPLQKSFSKKFIVVVVAFLLNFISYHFIYAFEDVQARNAILTGLVFKTWQFMSTIALIHIVFYIDVLNYHLFQLNVVIRNDNGGRIVCGIASILQLDRTQSDISILSKIKSYKIIHYRLYEILQKINYVFGWSIVAILLQAFCDATYVSYWLYSSLRENRDLDGIIRRFN